jgi:heat shock protein HslJ
MLLKLANFILLLTTFAGLSACGLLGTPSDPLNESSWRLTELGSTPVIENRAPTLQFTDGSVRGSAGCNSFQGNYSAAGQRINFKELSMTLMACPDEQGVMEQERRFFIAMQAVENFQIDGAKLMLITQDGNTMLFIYEDNLP